MPIPSKTSSTHATSFTPGLVPDLPRINPALLQLQGFQEQDAKWHEWWNSVKQTLFKTDQALGIQLRAGQISVLEEAAARETADGFLEGKYTLTVTAGNVVTGMEITSATAPDGGTVSDVTFQTDRFKIYNGATGVTAFDVSAGKVRVGGTLIVDATTNKMYVGAGNYSNADTALFFDSTGRLSLKDKLTWDGTTLSVTGNVVIVSGTNYAGSPSVGGAANTIVSQGALATQNSASWTTQVSSRPAELTDGRITTAINAAGLIVSGVHPGVVVTTSGVAGLYLGSDFMGYYNGSAWRTYMDNSGNFFLTGSGANSLSWNGTTLAINGAITSTSGTIGGFTLGSTSFTAGSGANYISIDNSGAPQIQFGTGSNPISGLTSSGIVVTGSTGVGSLALAAGYSGGSGVVRVYNGASQTIFLSGSSGDVSASTFTGSGASLTSLNAGNISSGTLSNNRLPSGISVTTLTSSSTGNFGSVSISGTSVIDGGRNLISSAIQLGFSTGNKCNLVVDVVGGSDQSFGNYMSIFMNGSQVWVPYLTSAP